MRRALEALGATARAAYYPGEMHAFHALVFRERARECWTDIFGFLDQHARSPRVEPAAGGDRETAA
jgi:acetyl esterase